MKHYCCSDLHGFYNIYKQIKEYIEPEDMVYCLGDCGDRGPESWKTIKAVLDDPQFIYLKGNHDDMLCRAFDEVQENDWQMYWTDNLYYNGGDQTLQDVLAEMPESKQYINKLKKAPLIETYVNTHGTTIYLNHAGFNPWEEVPIDANQLLWDRKHLTDKLPKELILEKHPIVVHGHTRVSYIAQMNALHSTGTVPLHYGNGSKICIDLCTIKTKKAALLDLDDLNHIIFNVEEDK